MKPITPRNPASSDVSEPFRCTRCDHEDRGRIDRQPFPSELGERIVAEICVDCWEEWKHRQMLLINHYGLKLQDAQARDFLYANVRSYLFGEGESAEIDPEAGGSVKW